MLQVADESMDWREIHKHNQYNVAFPNEEVVSFLSSHKNSNKLALDLGCGLGNNVQPCLFYQIQYYGIDLSEDAIAKARKMYPNEKFSVGAFDRISQYYSPNYFDIVFDRCSLICADKLTIINSLHQVKDTLKLGGQFFWNFVTDESDFALAGPASPDKFIQSSEVDDLPNNTLFRGYTFLSPLDARLMLYELGLDVVSDTRTRYEQIYYGTAKRRVLTKCSLIAVKK